MLLATPIEIFSKILSVDPKIGRIILLGVGVFAGAAIVMGFNADFNTVLAVGAWILGFGVAVTILARVSDTMLATFVGWVTVLLFFSWAGTALAAKLVPGLSPPLAPADCIFRILEPCKDVQDKIAAGKADAANLPPVSIAELEASAATVLQSLEPQDKVVVGTHKVFIQFSGVIRREDIVSLADGLREVGWNVQGRSGERLGTASGLNEVRYSRPEDKEVAEALARSITAAGVGSEPVQARLMSIIQPDVLEAWISRT